MFYLQRQLLARHRYGGFWCHSPEKRRAKGTTVAALTKVSSGLDVGALTESLTCAEH